MAKKKRFRGHYCWICNQILSNEKFSGKGHSKHICKKCAKLTIKEREEKININELYELSFLLKPSKLRKIIQEKYLKSNSEKVALLAKKILEEIDIEAEEIKRDSEIYKELMELDTGYQDNQEDDYYFEDLYKSDDSPNFFDVEEDDELPF